MTFGESRYYSSAVEFHDAFGSREANEFLTSENRAKGWELVGLDHEKSTYQATGGPTIREGPVWCFARFEQSRQKTPAERAAESNFKKDEPISSLYGHATQEKPKSGQPTEKMLNALRKFHVPESEISQMDFKTASERIGLEIERVKSR